MRTILTHHAYGPWRTEAWHLASSIALALIARGFGLVVLAAAFVCLGWFATLLPALVADCYHAGGWVAEGWWLVAMLGAAGFLAVFAWICFRVPWRPEVSAARDGLVVIVEDGEVMEPRSLDRRCPGWRLTSAGIVWRGWLIYR